MKLYWLFLMAAILCALFSDKIVAIAKADKRLKKVIIIFSSGVILVFSIAIIASIVSQAK